MASPEFQVTGLSCILAEILSVDRCVSPPEYFYCCLRSRSNAHRDTNDPASGRRSTTFLEYAGLYQSRHFDGMSGDNRTGRFEQERIACRNSNCRTISGRRNADPFRAIAGSRNRRIPGAEGIQRFLTGGVLVFLVRSADAHPPDHRRVTRLAAPPLLPVDPVPSAHHAPNRGADAARARGRAHGRDRRTGAVRRPGGSRGDHCADAVCSPCLRHRAAVPPPRGAGRDRRTACDGSSRGGRSPRRRRRRGEAEDTWPHVLDDARRGKLEQVYVSSRQAPLVHMPAPRWDLIKGRRYGKSVTIATRGCPHRCDYCSIPLLYGPATVRYRPIDEVVREVATSPTRAVVFWDDNIGANSRYAKDLFRALEPLGKWWTSQCTANAARDEQFVELAARSGCKALFLGLESISQESLDATNKGHNRVDAYRRLIAMLHRYGVAVHLGIMFGFDQDDAGIFRRTAEFLEEACVDVPTVSMVVPMPGTPTFRRLSGDGRILTTDWSKYDGKKHCVFQPALMSPAELEAGTEGVARRC